MSYDNPRIGLTDTTLSAVVKLAEGNPGAITVLAEMMRRGEAIDPDNALGGLGALFSLDTLDIYGPRIWMLYKDVCGGDLVNTLGLLRAVQMGYLNERALNTAIDNRPPDDKWVDKFVNQVRERLPKFGKENGTA